MIVTRGSRIVCFLGAAMGPRGQSVLGIEKIDPFPKNPGCKFSEVTIIQIEQGSLDEWLTRAGQGNHGMSPSSSWTLKGRKWLENKRMGGGALRDTAAPSA